VVANRIVDKPRAADHLVFRATRSFAAARRFCTG